jgi:prepilin-type N-terminal cleavage/methylation domain-containing protein/prepilin-type processing-associated H-X9-DG protein
MHQRKGFTLIELLVVIAIIAILAAILFPVFAQAREKARQTTCTSNLKQLSTAIMMYYGDYDESYPMSVYAGRTTANAPCAYTAQAALEPYLKNKNIYECPTAAQSMNMDAFWRTRGLTGGDCGQFIWLSYVANFALFEDGPNNPITGSSHAVVSAAQVNFPAETSSFQDGHLASGTGTNTCGFNLFDSPVEGRHTGVVVVAYADGHAGNVKAAKIDCTSTNISGKSFNKYCVQSPPYNRTCGRATVDICHGSPSTPGSPDLWGVVQEDQYGKCVGEL